MVFADHNKRCAVALCWHLSQQENKGGLFYLSWRDLQRLAGLDNYKIAGQWLAQMMEDGVIKVVKPNSRSMATEYRYVPIASEKQQ
jgi:hypothetical protein